MGDDLGISSKYLFVYLNLHLLCNLTGIYKMEQSLFSNLALKRSSDLQKVSVFFSGRAYHFKIRQQKTMAQRTFPSAFFLFVPQIHWYKTCILFESLNHCFLFVLIPLFIISFMLDLNSLDCKLHKGQRIYLFS